MGVRILDYRIDAAQELAIGAGNVRLIQGVENRLVVLVHENDHALAGLTVQRGDQVGKTAGRGGVFVGYLALPFDGCQLLHEVGREKARILEAAAAEAQAQNGMANGPVPLGMDVQPREERLAALEYFLERIQQQALAEPPRAGEEEVRSLFDQPLDEGGLVDVVAPLLPNLAEGLDADGQLALGHVAAP